MPRFLNQDLSPQRMNEGGNACSFRSNADPNHTDLTFPTAPQDNPVTTCWSNTGRYCSALAHLFCPDHAPPKLLHICLPLIQSLLCSSCHLGSPSPPNLTLDSTASSTPERGELILCTHSRLLQRASYLRLSYGVCKCPKDRQCQERPCLAHSGRVVKHLRDEGLDGGNEMNTNKP